MLLQLKLKMNLEFQDLTTRGVTYFERYVVLKLKKLKQIKVKSRKFQFAKTFSHALLCRRIVRGTKTDSSDSFSAPC